MAINSTLSAAEVRTLTSPSLRVDYRVFYEFLDTRRGTPPNADITPFLEIDKSVIARKSGGNVPGSARLYFTNRILRDGQFVEFPLTDTWPEVAVTIQAICSTGTVGSVSQVVSFDLGKWLLRRPRPTLNLSAGKSQTILFELSEWIIALSGSVGKTIGWDAGDNFWDVCIRELLDDYRDQDLRQRSVVRRVSRPDFTLDHSIAVPWKLGNRVDWLVQDDASYLHIANRLLSASGWAKLYSNRQGVLTTYEFVPIAERRPLWTISLTEENWIESRSQVNYPRDTVPNRWIGVELPGSNRSPFNVETVELVNEDGSLRNAETGQTLYSGVGLSTSQQRTNRVETRVVNMDPGDSEDGTPRRSTESALAWTALVDMQQAASLDIPMRTLPIFWHFENVEVDIPVLGNDFRQTRGVVTEWSLPLDSARSMTLKVEVPI